MRAAIDPAEREAAAAIFPLVNQNHKLLVTLLLMNAVAYECLPLFLDKLLPAYLTIIFSVSFLLIFGELIPSKFHRVDTVVWFGQLTHRLMILYFTGVIFTGPDQLLLASKLAPLVKFCMMVLHPISHPLVKLMDSIVPEDPAEVEDYNRAELSALVRIQYEERMKAQRQRDLANALDIDISPRSNQSTRIRNAHVQRMANQINAEKQRRNHDAYQTKSTRSWRRLKEEIMHAVAEKHQSSENDDGDEDSESGSKGHHKRVSSGGFQSILQRIPSSSQVSSATPVEQIAPPLERTEVRVVEGALNLKTMCALDVYTPLRMLFSVSEDLLLTKEAFAHIYGQGYSRVPVYEPQPPPNEHRISKMKGILMTRQLIMIDWEDDRPVSSLPLYIPPCVSPRMNLVKLLDLLRKGGSLIAFVCAGE